MTLSNVEAPAERRSGPSYGKVAKVGVLWSFGQKFVSQSIDLAASVVLARLLTPADFGIVAATGFFLRLASKLANFGLGGALIRLKEMRPEHVSTVFVVNLGIGILSYLCLTASAPSLAVVFDAPEVAPALRVAALVYLVLPFGAGQAATISREMRFRDLAIVEWTYSAAFLLLAIPLAWQGFGFWSLIYAQLAANSLQTIAKVYIGGRQPRLKFSRAAFLETIPFGAGLYVRRVLSFGAEYFDSLIVGSLLGMTSLGFYDKAFSTVNRVSDRLNAPIVFLRIFAVIQHDAARLRKAYLKACSAMALIGLPSFAGLIVAAPNLIEVLYGRQWLPAVVPFQILCVAGMCKVTLANATAVIQAVGEVWSETWRQVVYVVFVIVGVASFSVWGIAGAAAAVTLAAAVMMVLVQWLVCRVTGLRWTEILQAHIPGLTAAAVVAAALVAIEFAFAASETPRAWVVLIVQLVAAGAAMLAVLFLGPFDSMRAIARETVTEFAPGLLERAPVFVKIRLGQSPSGGP